MLSPHSVVRVAETRITTALRMKLVGQEASLSNHARHELAEKEAFPLAPAFLRCHREMERELLFLPLNAIILSTIPKKTGTLPEEDYNTPKREKKINIKVDKQIPLMGLGLFL